MGSSTDTGICPGPWSWGAAGTLGPSVHHLFRSDLPGWPESVVGFVQVGHRTIVFLRRAPTADAISCFFGSPRDWLDGQVAMRANLADPCRPEREVAIAFGKLHRRPCPVGRRAFPGKPWRTTEDRDESHLRRTSAPRASASDCPDHLPALGGDRGRGHCIGRGWRGARDGHASRYDESISTAAVACVSAAGSGHQIGAGAIGPRQE